MVVQGEGDLGGMMEYIDRGFSWYELVPDKGYEVKEGAYLLYSDFRCTCYPRSTVGRSRTPVA